MMPKGADWLSAVGKEYSPDFRPGGTTRHAPRWSGGSAARLSSQVPIVTEVAYFLQIEPGPTVTAAAVRNREIVGAGR